jgi:hypothetical protein
MACSSRWAKHDAKAMGARSNWLSTFQSAVGLKVLLGRDLGSALGSTDSVRSSSKATHRRWSPPCTSRGRK